MRGAARFLMSAALIVSALVLAPTPATAASDLPLEYSLDGIHWSSADPALMPDSWRPVPGSTTTTTLHVRSTRAAASRIALYLGAVESPSSSLVRATTVAGRLAVVGFTEADRCVPLDEATLEPGQAASFSVVVSVSGELDDAQLAPLSFALDASMSDPQVVPVRAGCPAESATGFPDPAPAADGDLPRTGGNVGGAVAIAAGGGALTLLGLWIRRRRRDPR